VAIGGVEMTEACKTIRNAVIEAQKVFAASAVARDGDPGATITQVLHFLDSQQLLRPLAETADEV
jgi:predicted pyridoxine 5'-phosphate oxidase superfamily flavin-nucleotide-binding protein